MADFRLKISCHLKKKGLQNRVAKRDHLIIVKTEPPIKINDKLRYSKNSEKPKYMKKMKHQE